MVPPNRGGACCAARRRMCSEGKKVGILRGMGKVFLFLWEEGVAQGNISRGRFRAKVVRRWDLEWDIGRQCGNGAGFDLSTNGGAL